MEYDFWMMIAFGIMMFFILAGIGAMFGLAEAIPKWIKQKQN